MLLPSRLRASTVAIALALAIGCSSDTASPDAPGTERPSDALNVARVATTAPPLESDNVSFWAVKGQSVEQKLYFLDSQGLRGEEYLRLRLEAGSLSLLRDGSAIAEGDSVLITITVEDPARLLFELQPTGLQFSATAPAELKISYAQADHDFNDDGAINVEDSEVETRLGIWRQELPGQPFLRLGSVKIEGQEELEAELQGFSRYAIAY